VKILGFDYALSLMEAKMADSRHYGECNNNTLTIRIARELPRQQKEATVLHEILEAVGYCLGLNLNEQTMLALERGLHGALAEAGVDLSPLVVGLEEP
jgi:hypothetical protein